MALNFKIKMYERTGKLISQFDLNKQITILKKENEWLKEVNSQSLQSITRNLKSAFTRFFREKNGFPNFKSKKNPIQSFPIPQHYYADFEKGIVKLPRIGEVKAVVKAFLHRSFEGTLKTAIVSRSATGEYYISILVDDDKEFPEKQEFSEPTTLGINVGIKDFAVLSTEEKIEKLKYLQNSLKRLKVLQKRVSRKQKGSKSREKAKQRLDKFHEK